MGTTISHSVSKEVAERAKKELALALKPHEDRFENFYIRYDVLVGEAEYGNLWIDADVYEVAEWSADGQPIFYNGGPRAPVTDPAEARLTFNLHTKWDGCTHLRVPQFHFDGLDKFASFVRCVRYIYRDVCARHDVID